MSFSIYVPGVPVSKGSMKAFRTYGTNNIVLTESDPNSKKWQALITQQIRYELMAQDWSGLNHWVMLKGEVAVWLNFFLPKPKSFPKKVKNFWHPKRPDIDKLTRGVLDAMTKAEVWEDDSQVCVLRVTKQYADASTHKTSGVRIRVEPINSEINVNDRHVEACNE